MEPTSSSAASSSFVAQLLIMEPTFSSAASSSSVTPSLQAQIDDAIAALPLTHRQPPFKGEIVESKEAGYRRLQDWAFTHGFALAIESANAKRMRLECVHHEAQTKNRQKTPENARVRVQTQIMSRNCRFGLYISRQKRLGDQWGIGSSCLHHNHAPNPDPFQYIQHRSKRPKRSNTLATITHSNIINNTASTASLRNRKKYHLRRLVSSGKTLTRQAELEPLLGDLEQEGDEGLRVDLREGSSGKRELSIQTVYSN